MKWNSEKFSFSSVIILHIRNLYLNTNHTLITTKPSKNTDWVQQGTLRKMCFLVSVVNPSSTTGLSFIASLSIRCSLCSHATWWLQHWPHMQFWGGISYGLNTAVQKWRWSANEMFHTMTQNQQQNCHQTHYSWS